MSATININLFQEYFSEENIKIIQVCYTSNIKRFLRSLNDNVTVVLRLLLSNLQCCMFPLIITFKNK